MKNSVSKIGILTSGGDAPGMNAAIRAVVRSSIYYGRKVSGIINGYTGLIEGEIEEMDARSVGNIIQRGGTILKSARSEAFKTAEGRAKAAENLKKHNIDALVTIGGNGTFTGAHLLQQESGIPVIGVPGTIDNDLMGTDVTIGYDTATNTAIEAIDKIRDTASSHNRLFFIEVMGRHSGFIAVRCGLAVGAEVIIIPEKEISMDEVVLALKQGKKKEFSLVIVAEGSKNGTAIEIAEWVRQEMTMKTKVTILGHLQRGSPSGFDRVLASRMGVGAVEGLINDQSDVMVGMINEKIVYTPLETAISRQPGISGEMMRIANILSI